MFPIHLMAPHFQIGMVLLLSSRSLEKEYVSSMMPGREKLCRELAVSAPCMPIERRPTARF